MMAAKDVKTATDNLSCPVCYQLFKKPKYLPCHHSYCEHCLEMLREKSKIICPECRKESIVPPGGVKDLDDNFFITRLVDELILNRKIEGDEEVKCDECSGIDPVVTFCPDCIAFLCHVCNEHHKRSNKSRDHGIIPLAELRSKKNFSIQPKPKAMMCREHDKELLFYCETCDQLVCMYCRVKDHNGHNHDTVKKMVDKHRQELKKITAPVAEMVRSLSNVHDDVVKMGKKIKQQGDEVNNEIDQHYDRAIQKFINEKKKLKQQVYYAVSEKEEALTIQLSEIDCVQAEILKMKAIKEDVEKGFDQDVLSVKKEVIDQMQQITDKYKKVNAPPSQQATIKFVPIKNTVSQIGKVDSTDTHKYTAFSADTTSHSKKPITSTAQVATSGATGSGVITTHGMTMTSTPVTLSTPVSPIHSRNSLTTKAASKLASKFNAAGISTPNTTSASGKKRRRRCLDCDGCKAPKCETCKYCLDPTLKRPCIMKTCKQLQ